jgi:hypothetical protein
MLNPLGFADIFDNAIATVTTARSTCWRRLIPGPASRWLTLRADANRLRYRYCYSFQTKIVDDQRRARGATAG